MTPPAIPIKPARITRRILNYAIDGLFCAIVVAGLHAAIPSHNQTAKAIVALCVVFAYYFSFEYFFQKTLGKFITKTRVVNLRSHKPTLEDILLRSIVRFTPFESLSFIAKRPVGFHDKWSDTRVIQG